MMSKQAWRFVPSSANMRAGKGGKAPGLRSVGFAVIFGALQLHLQPLHTDLKAIHGLDGSLRWHWIVIADKTKALAQIGLFVNEDFGRDHISERHEHLQDVLVPKFLGQVIDEQVGTLWPCREEKGEYYMSMYWNKNILKSLNVNKIHKKNKKNKSWSYYFLYC